MGQGGNAGEANPERVEQILWSPPQIQVFPFFLGDSQFRCFHVFGRSSRPFMMGGYCGLKACLPFCCCFCGFCCYE